MKEENLNIMIEEMNNYLKIYKGNFQLTDNILNSSNHIILANATLEINNLNRLTISGYEYSPLETITEVTNILSKYLGIDFKYTPTMYLNKTNIFKFGIHKQDYDKVVPILKNIYTKGIDTISIEDNEMSRGDGLYSPVFKYTSTTFSYNYLLSENNHKLNYITNNFIIKEMI